MKRLAVLGVVGVVIVVIALALTRYEYGPESFGQRERLDRWTGERASCPPHGPCVQIPKTCGDCSETPPETPVAPSGAP